MEYSNKILSLLFLFSIFLTLCWCCSSSNPPSPPTSSSTSTREPRGGLKDDPDYYGGDDGLYTSDEDVDSDDEDNKKSGKVHLGIKNKTDKGTDDENKNKIWGGMSPPKGGDWGAPGMNMGGGPNGLQGMGGWGPGSGPGGAPGEWTPQGWKNYKNGEWGGPGGGAGGWGPGYSPDENIPQENVTDTPPDGGKPYFCYLPKERGDCATDQKTETEKGSRWYYQLTGDDGDCFEFTYSGCGGNENNFEFALNCLYNCDKEVECCNTISNETDY